MSCLNELTTRIDNQNNTINALGVFNLLRSCTLPQNEENIAHDRACDQAYRQEKSPKPFISGGDSPKIMFGREF
jgi:hypothetical protein